MYTALFVCFVVWVVTFWMLKNKQRAGGYETEAGAAVATCIIGLPSVAAFFGWIGIGMYLVIRWINN